LTPFTTTVHLPASSGAVPSSHSTLFTIVDFPGGRTTSLACDSPEPRGSSWFSLLTVPDLSGSQKWSVAHSWDEAFEWLPSEFVCQMARSQWPAICVAKEAIETPKALTFSRNDIWAELRRYKVFYWA
jgi:hypothetical protein